MRCLFRNYRGASVRFIRRRRYLDRDRTTSSGRAVCGGANAAMIRVILPGPLSMLAHTSQLELDVHGQVTLRSVLDALEAQYPMLRGTIRDHITQQCRPLLRLFACEKDLSHEPL